MHQLENIFYQQKTAAEAIVKNIQTEKIYKIKHTSL